MNVFELTDKLSLEKVNISDGTREISGGFACDLLSHALANGFEGCAWATVMTNINVVAIAFQMNISCVILCGGVSLDGDALYAAREHGINVLSTDKTVYEVCRDMGKSGI